MLGVGDSDENNLMSITGASSGMGEKAHMVYVLVKECTKCSQSKISCQKIDAQEALLVLVYKGQMKQRIDREMVFRNKL